MWGKYNQGHVLRGAKVFQKHEEERLEYYLSIQIILPGPAPLSSHSMLEVRLFTERSARQDVSCFDAINHSSNRG